MSISMRLRLFLLLTMLVITIILAVLAVLTLTGTLVAGVKETENDIRKELSHSSSNIMNQFDQIAGYTVLLSKDLSNSIENYLIGEGLTVNELKSHPEILENLVGSQYKQSLFSLQRANCSGVFIILDATVNPALENAVNSKAGLYIKNMEPNILNSESTYLFIMRGFSSIGRENSVTLHSQWRMEFDVDGASYYYDPMDAARNRDLPLSRLYHLSDAMTMPGTNEEVMLCSAPLIDSMGNVFGVCGFEVSSMLFKLLNMPDTSTYQRIFCMLAPVLENKVNTCQVFTAGGYSTRNFTEENQTLTIENDEPFNLYHQRDGTLFSGLHQSINLYPEGSPFQDEQWIVALLMPDKDISASIVKSNLKLLFLFLTLLIIGITLSYFLSRRFLIPLAKSIEAIKSKDYKSLSKTNIIEIDDLIEYLSSNEAILNQNISDNDKHPNPIETLSMNRFDEFAEDTKSLSPAERAVFNLYIEGYTAKEIAQILCLSINTIKTHNKRIYMKLNVSSREELLLYLNILKETGREIR